MGKRQSFQQMCWENWTATCRRIKLDHFLTAHTNIEWMKDLKVRQESIKILEENTGSNLFDLSHSNVFLETLPKTREARAKMNYWDFINIKSFCTAKETVNKTKRQLTEWKKIFANDLSVKDLYQKFIKNLPNSTPKEQIIQSRNGQKT